MNMFDLRGLRSIGFFINMEVEGPNGYRYPTFYGEVS